VHHFVFEMERSSMELLDLLSMPGSGSDTLEPAEAGHGL
jgi:hypothetical protein